MDRVQELQAKLGDKVGKSITKKDRFYFEVKDEDLHEVVDYLFNTMGCRLSTATAQETYHWIEVLYQFSFDESGEYFCPRVIMTDKENPEMNSITSIVKGAEWIEREMTDYWGITFRGHPRPEPLLIKNHPFDRKNQFRFRRIDGNDN